MSFSSPNHDGDAKDPLPRPTDQRSPIDTFSSGDSSTAFTVAETVELFVTSPWEERWQLIEDAPVLLTTEVMLLVEKKDSRGAAILSVARTDGIQTARMDNETISAISRQGHLLESFPQALVDATERGRSWLGPIFVAALRKLIDAGELTDKDQIHHLALQTHALLHNVDPSLLPKLESEIFSGTPRAVLGEWTPILPAEVVVDMSIAILEARKVVASDADAESQLTVFLNFAMLADEIGESAAADGLDILEQWRASNFDVFGSGLGHAEALFRHYEHHGGHLFLLNLYHEVSRAAKTITIISRSATRLLQLHFNILLAGRASRDELLRAFLRLRYNVRRQLPDVPAEHLEFLTRAMPNLIENGVLPPGAILEDLDYVEQYIRRYPDSEFTVEMQSRRASALALGVKMGRLRPRKLRLSLKLTRALVLEVQDGSALAILYRMNLGNRLAQGVRIGILPESALIEALRLNVQILETSDFLSQEHARIACGNVVNRICDCLEAGCEIDIEDLDEWIANLVSVALSQVAPQDLNRFAGLLIHALAKRARSGDLMPSTGDRVIQLAETAYHGMSSADESLKVEFGLELALAHSSFASITIQGRYGRAKGLMEAGLRYAELDSDLYIKFLINYCVVALDCIVVGAMEYEELMRLASLCEGSAGRSGDEHPAWPDLLNNAAVLYMQKPRGAGGEASPALLVFRRLLATAGATLGHYLNLLASWAQASARGQLTTEEFDEALGVGTALWKRTDLPIDVHQAIGRSLGIVMLHDVRVPLSEALEIISASFHARNIRPDQMEDFAAFVEASSWRFLDDSNAAISVLVEAVKTLFDSATSFTPSTVARLRSVGYLENALQNCAIALLQRGDSAEFLLTTERLRVLASGLSVEEVWEPRSLFPDEVLREYKALQRRLRSIAYRTQKAGVFTEEARALQRQLRDMRLEYDVSDADLLLGRQEAAEGPGRILLYLVAGDREGYAVARRGGITSFFRLPELRTPAVLEMAEALGQSAGAAEEVGHWVERVVWRRLRPAIAGGASLSIIPLGRVAALPVWLGTEDWTTSVSMLTLPLMCMGRELPAYSGRDLLCVSAPAEMALAKMDLRAWQQLGAGREYTVSVDSTRNDILRELDHAKTFLFSGHGLHARDAGGGLNLHDGVLAWFDIERLHPKRRGLAFLNACSTGQVSWELTGQLLGLPRSLLYIGFASVVGTGWPVRDLTAFCFLARFLELSHLDSSKSPPEVVASVRNWMRNVTVEELIPWARNLCALDVLGPEEETMVISGFESYHASQRPFQDTADWGAHVAFASEWK